MIARGAGEQRTAPPRLAWNPPRRGCGVWGINRRRERGESPAGRRDSLRGGTAFGFGRSRSSSAAGRRPMRSGDRRSLRRRQPKGGGSEETSQRRQPSTPRASGANAGLAPTLVGVELMGGVEEWEGRLHESTLPRPAPLGVRDPSHRAGSGRRRSAARFGASAYGPPRENSWPRIAPSLKSSVWTLT